MLLNDFGALVVEGVEVRPLLYRTDGRTDAAAAAAAATAPPPLISGDK